MKHLILRAVVALTLMLLASYTAAAQNLLASQLNFYFGHPETIIVNNSQGTSKTTLDRQGRILRIEQGSRSVVYDWEDEGEMVTLSMYQGESFSGSLQISILSNTKDLLKYSLGEGMESSTYFKSNGAVDKAVMVNPQTSMTIQYFYRDPSDMYPYASEISMGDQSMKVAIDILERDSYGNVTKMTSSNLGNTDTSSATVTYYE